MRSRKQYILVETLISVAINTVLSVVFVLIVFHGDTFIPAANIHRIVADLAPQTFMVILMSFLVPSLLTRRRRSTGALSWHDGEPAGVRYNVFLWAGVVASLGTILVVMVSWFVLPALLSNGVSFRWLLLSKAAFGATLAALATPWAIRKAIG